MLFVDLTIKGSPLGPSENASLQPEWRARSFCVVARPNEQRGERQAHESQQEPCLSWGESEHVAPSFSVLFSGPDTQLNGSRAPFDIDRLDVE